MKLQSYAPEEKVWFNSKYIKIKQNRKLEAKFFGLFQILHLIGKPVYKLDLSTKWKIYNVFHMSLLEQDTTRKRRMDELFRESEPEFNTGNNKEYKVEVIIDSAVYAKKADENLPGLYYLVFWKSYPEEKSTWKPSFAVMHFWKMISIFHKDYLKKLTAIFSLFNSTPSMAKPSVKPPVKASAKQKQGRSISSTKQAKEWDIGRWGFFFPVFVRLEGFFTNSVEHWEFYQFCKLWKKCIFSIIFLFYEFLPISSILPLCLSSKNTTLPFCSLFMSDTLPPVFRFSSLVSYWVRRFFIRLVLGISFSVSHWIRRFFIYYALSKLYFYTLTRSAELTSLRKRNCNIVILKIEVIWQVTWQVLILTLIFFFFWAKLCSITLTKLPV